MENTDLTERAGERNIPVMQKTENGTLETGLRRGMLAVTEDKTRQCFQRKDRYTEILHSLILIKVYHGNHSSPQNTNK